MITPIVGRTYELFFEYSDEGLVEDQDPQRSVEFTCVDVNDRYMCFERELAPGGPCEGIEFFYHEMCEHHKEWWDENLWVRLVHLKGVS